MKFLIKSFSIMLLLTLVFTACKETKKQDELDANVTIEKAEAIEAELDKVTDELEKEAQELDKALDALDEI